MFFWASCARLPSFFHSSRICSTCLRACSAPPISTSILASLVPKLFAMSLCLFPSKLGTRNVEMKDKKTVSVSSTDTVLKLFASNLSSGLRQTSRAICSKPLERFAAFVLTGPTGYCGGGGKWRKGRMFVYYNNPLTITSAYTIPNAITSAQNSGLHNTKLYHKSPFHTCFKRTPTYNAHAIHTSRRHGQVSAIHI